jgi:hypothetical protein
LGNGRLRPHEGRHSTEQNQSQTGWLFKSDQ